jgi:hypothetical protein
VWQCTPIVPTTWEAEAGVFFELRSFRPTWATQQDSVSKKNKKAPQNPQKPKTQKTPNHLSTLPKIDAICWAWRLRPVIQLLGRQRLGGLQFKVCPDKKLVDPISTIKLSVVEYIYDPSYWGGVKRRIVVQAGPGKNVRSCMNNN